MARPPHLSTPSRMTSETVGVSVRPLNEGLIQKGGQNPNPAASFVTRPAPPVGSSGGTNTGPKATPPRPGK